jgi:hypothetical protein
MGYKLETLAKAMATSYERAAERDGFHMDSEGKPEKYAYHERWMLAVLKDLTETKIE